MRWTPQIFEQIRPHHFLKLLYQPKRAIRELKYRYTFTSPVAFCTYLTQTPSDKVRLLFNECSNQECFREAEDKAEKLKPGSGRGKMGRETEPLYVITRILKPSLVVETGVGAGISSTYILQALRLNGRGKLYSIDLPDQTGLSGWAVPDELRQYWDLRLGSSKDIMPALLQEIGPIDMFLHDSDHSYEYMMYEFRTVWPSLKNDGLFLAHDVGRNDALFDFCREAGVSWLKVRTFPVLGGLRKVI
jgi:predicted O-methyltransferase YrrM